MNLIRVVSIAVLLAQVGIGGANAQALRNADEPAEFPPASYKGSQYVDSRGCVYIRAGIEGNVTWVPRVSRSRQQICGAKPTLAGKPAAPAAKPATQTAAAKPVQIVPEEPVNASPKSARAQAQAAPKPRAAAAPKPRRVATAKPAPVQIVPQRRAQPAVRQQRPMATIASAPAPRRMIATPAPVLYGATAVAPGKTVQRRVAVPARKTAAAPRTMTRQVASCAGASAISSQYMRGDGVRCGPQAVSPVGNYAYTGATRANRPVAAAPQARQQQLPRQIRLTNTTRIAPRHVVHAQAQAADVGQVPKGYRRVWDDDRLNPKRAHQTLAGKQAMELRWTRDLPRRLIDIRTRQDVTAFYPDLVYPYTDMNEQIAEQNQYTRQTQYTQQPQQRRSTGYLSTKGKAPKATVSTRSAPKAPRVKPSATSVRVGVSHRFVQVGTYPSAAAAQSDAARLRAAGLTVRTATLRSSGSKVLLAGPYNSTQMLGNALYAARQAGFPGAFTRK